MTDRLDLEQDMNLERRRGRQAHPVFDTFNQEAPTRWNKQAMQTLNNVKPRYSARMNNPVFAKAFADYNQWEYNDADDIDGDEEPDIVVRNKPGDIVWYNGWTGFNRQNL